MGSPTSALMAQTIMQRLAQAGQAGGGAAGVQQPEQKGEQLSSSFMQLQSADPDMANKTLEKIQLLLGPMYMAMIQQVPDAASHIAQAQKAINAARKSIQQAAATLNAVRPQIANSAALPPNFQPGGMAGMSGAGGGGEEGM